MADSWNITSIEPLDDTNYFLWKEKVEGILRSKKLWKKVIGVKPLEKPKQGMSNYEERLKIWDEWDDNNYAARTIMINTMSKELLLKYNYIRNADTLWHTIKENMAAETEELKSRSLNELSNIRMKRDETVDGYINRAEALRNQCLQLGKIIENFEFKMYLMRGLRPEYDPNVRILETQRNISVNDIRYALKQEELRRMKRREERKSMDSEQVRRIKEDPASEGKCYNCGIKGHLAKDCNRNKRCFNCQGFNHIAANCRERKRNMPLIRRGSGGNQGGSRGRNVRQQRGRDEYTLNTREEAVLRVSEIKKTKQLYEVSQINENDTQISEIKKEEKLYEVGEMNEIDMHVCESNNYRVWLLDSGATSHMTNDELICKNFVQEERRITMADKEGKVLISKGIGNVIVKQSSNKNNVKLEDVLCVPELNSNLLSVAKITDHGYDVNFNKYGAIIYNKLDGIQMTAVRVQDAYYVRTSINNEKIAAVSTNTEMWHKRLGHANQDVIEEMRKNNLALGMDSTWKQVCESCVEGKAFKKSHPRCDGRRTRGIMELWHTDLIGPIKPSSYGMKKYILTIIDDFSRMIFIKLLGNKSEAAEELKRIIILKENQTGQRLRRIRSDNGGEYLGRNLKNWFDSKGIKHELSPPMTPECNGIAERANRTIIETSRTMLADSKLNLMYWGEAANTAVYIRNRVKSRVHGKTPYEIWYKKQPNIKHMRRFGCVAYLLNKGGQRRKFDVKTLKGIFMGYNDNNTYRIYLPETKTIKCDCDVRFDEERNGSDLLRYKEGKNDEKEKLINLNLDVENEEEDNETIEEEIDEERQSRIEMHEEEEINEEENSNSDYEDARNEVYEDEDTRKKRNNEIQEVRLEQGLTAIKGVGRPKNLTKEAIIVNKYLRKQEQEKLDVEKGVRRSLRIRNQKALRSMDIKIPSSMKEAKQLPDWDKWKEAVESELESLRRHEVWKIVSQPKGKKIIKCKWIFNVKENYETQERKYKARLVAVGCSQRPGYDYEETFSPTIRIETIRLLFSICAEIKRKIKIYDVKTAFLHGTLNEEIYMEIPDGEEKGNGLVCELKKSIYGLKQASKCWNKYLTDSFLQIGLKQSIHDPCLFYVREGEHFLYCGVHVDDMTIVSSTDSLEEKYISKLNKYMELKNLGIGKQLLGMELNYEGEKLIISQKHYIKNILNAYGMSECNAVSSPIDVNQKFNEDDESPAIEEKSYQELLGKLMYLSVSTRPDISYTLSCLSQFSKNPRVIHMNALKRVLRYLKGTINYQIEFGKSNMKKEVICYTDASWDSTADARSFSGILVYRNQDLVHWRSRKQATVALSSTESELEAMLEGLKEVSWMNDLLNEIGMSINYKELKCDNLNAVKLANGGNFKSKTKLLNRKCHFVREIVMNYSVKMSHVPKERMIADCMTKALSGPSLLRNIKSFMCV